VNSALAAAITKGSGAGMFGQVVGNSMIGTGLGVLEEYGKQQMGYGNHFDAFSHTGLEGLGGIAAAAITGLGYEAMQSPTPYDPFSNSPTAPNDLRNVMAGGALDELMRNKPGVTLGSLLGGFLDSLLAPAKAIAGLFGQGYDGLAGLFSPTGALSGVGNLARFLKYATGDAVNRLFADDAEDIRIIRDGQVASGGLGGTYEVDGKQITDKYDFGTAQTAINKRIAELRKEYWADGKLTQEEITKYNKEVAELYATFGPHKESGANPHWLDDTSRAPSFMSEKWREAMWLMASAGDNDAQYYKGFSLSKGYNWNDTGVNVVGLRNDSTASGQNAHDDYLIVIRDNKVVGLFSASVDPGVARDSTQPLGVAHLPEGNYRFQYDTGRGVQHKYNDVLIPSSEILVQRDANGDGFITGNEKSTLYSAERSIWFHFGGWNDYLKDFSLGCQVINGNVGFDVQNNKPLSYPDVVKWQSADRQGSFNDFLRMVQPGGSNINYVLMQAESARGGYVQRYNDYIIRAQRGLK